ncbi:Patched domain-containing protein 3 [Toxocara canis]|uniref:Patched domain-containing protein 3 n=1 Tax=Toxocara canis TaxID=6265 RepID=A0A0B2UMR3_TOXCA|nr:Patched domain-containing protein 3 [Toxocara canis]
MSVRHEIEKRTQEREMRRQDSTRPPHRRSSILVGQRSLEIIEESGDKEPTFVVLIVKCYKKWGYIIAKYAWPAILTCLLISGLSTVKIFLTPQKNDITGYTPFEARSRVEYKQYTSFFSHDGLAIATYIFVMAKDGGSLLRPEYLKETVDILDLALNNVTMYNKDLNVNQSFSEFCINFCSINDPVRQFYNGLLIQQSSVMKGDGLNERLKLEYPISSLFGRSFSVQPNFFGVELYNETSSFHETANLEETVQLLENETLSTDAIPRNRTSAEVHITNIKMVKMISLQFRAEHLAAWTDDDVKNWEMRMVHFFQDNYKSDRLILYVLSQTYVEDEMVRAGVSLLPYLIVGFIIMCTCSAVTVIVRAAYMHQNNMYKILLAIMACITPLMACSTALAIMFLVGVRFSSILCVIPFLVLSIGVDSSYLMIHEWQRVTKELREHKPRKDDCVGHRMSEVLMEVGPAILISAITNILADGVGCWTSSPEIRLLCIGNLFSMFIAFIYQMTFYSGLMSIVGENEIKAEKIERNKMEIMIRDAKVDIRRNNELTGITRININLTTQKLFAADSPLLTLDQYRVEYQVPTFTMATVFVNSPGDLSRPTHLALMDRMVDDFEHLPGSWGPTGTMYFVRDFMRFENSMDVEQEDYDYNEDEQIPATPKGNFKFRNEDLQTFLAWPEYDFWSGFVQLQNETIDGSRSFHASVFHEDGVFLDLIDNMPTDTWQSVLGTLICMAAVCFIFLRSMLTVAIATCCVLSICIGILGILSWWGVDLDPIAMAAMIISVGFSVDIPAHVSYHYYKACECGRNASPQERLGSCLSSVAFPALQAALSTALCVSSLLLAKIYMARVFVKTMVLCVLLCNMHGLVFLPAILSLVDRLKAKCKRKKTHDMNGSAEKHRRKLRPNIAARHRSNDIEAQQMDKTKVDRPPLPDH